MPPRAVFSRLAKLAFGTLDRAVPAAFAGGFFSIALVSPVQCEEPNGPCAISEPISSKGIAAAPSAEQGSLADTISGEVRRIFAEHKDAVVKVRARDSFGIRFGSGFFLDPSGTIYTHAGIVMKAQEVTVIHAGRELPARVLIVDPRSGVAIIKVDCNSPFIPIGDSNQVGIATPLVEIGYPEDLGASPSFGMVAGFDRQYLGQYFCTTHLRANMSVQDGQGGAPVMNLKGEAVGILVGRMDGAACHILPMRAAEKVRMDFIRFGEMRPAYAGVIVEDAGQPSGGSTARVGELDPASPAARSGLKAGDILLQVGTTPIATSEDVLDAAFFLTVGDNTKIDVLRNGEKISVTLKPSIHPMVCPHEMQAIAPNSLEKIQLE